MDDIGEVDKDTDTISNSCTIDGEVDSVLSTTKVHQCKVCKPKTDKITETFAKCTKCIALTKASKCTVTSFAKVVVCDKV